MAPPITTKQNVQKQNKDKPNTHIFIKKKIKNTEKQTQQRVLITTFKRFSLSLSLSRAFASHLLLPTNKL